MEKMKLARSKQTSLWRLRDGNLEPYCAETQAFVRSKKYANNDIVSITMRKARSPESFKAAHLMAKVMGDNIDALSHLQSHQILKRLQLEADIGCEVIGVVLPEVGPMLYRIPQSLSFENMDEGEFQIIMRGLCNHVADTYWPDCTPAQIMQMSAVFVEPA